MKITQTWNDKTVTKLMHQACGDLILDGRGNLCRRDTWNAETTKELPFAQHGVGELLALITRDGWALTKDGARFILENCPPYGHHDKWCLTWIVSH